MDSLGFEKLADAIEFLAANLEAKDFEVIAARCVDSIHDDERAVLCPREARIRAIEELGRRHAALSLRWRYFWRRFPARAGEFKLGGHAKQLGHVHVDFVRSGPLWQLKEIWICR